MSRLTSLDLGLCSSITDEGLKELENLVALKSLNIEACRYTDTGRNELAKKLPDLNITS